MKVLTAPEPLIIDFSKPSVFLAGSIEMDQAENWQQEAIEAFSNQDITVLNPRRKEWDSTWKQDINNPNFKQQVEWELTAQEQCDIIMMNFVPSTKSPITLLELGLFAESGKLIVCCPKNYWRRGNVEITCRRYGIQFCESFNELIVAVEQSLF